jgi:molecular chaperone GrpE
MSEKDIKKEQVEELKNEETESVKTENEVKKDSQDVDQEAEKEEEKEAKKEDKKKKKSKKPSKEDQIEELGNKLQDVNDKYLRLSAEFDNYRKRTLKEKMELTKTAGEQILVNILPVMDNFERAIKSIEDAKEVEAIKEGIMHIYKNFGEFLKQNGVAEIDSANAVFDTDLHEALTKIPAPSEELKGKVVDCIEKGYKLNDKVIRYAKVVVGE